MAADIEGLLVPWLHAQRPGSRVCTETPSDLAQIAETIRVARAGGGQNLVLGRPRIVIDSFAIKTDDLSAKEAARALACAVDELMLWTLRRSKLGNFYVTMVEQTSGPSWVPDANKTIRHYVATYSLAVR